MVSVERRLTVLLLWKSGNNVVVGRNSGEEGKDEGERRRED